MHLAINMTRHDLSFNNFNLKRLIYTGMIEYIETNYLNISKSFEFW